MLIEIYSWFNLILTSAPTTRMSTWNDTDSVAIRSPTRSTLALLCSAAPPVEICQPGPAAAASPEEAVNKMKGFLLDGYDKAFIPRQLEVCTFAQFPLKLTPSYRPDCAKLLRMKLLPYTTQCLPEFLTAVIWDGDFSTPL